MMRIVFMGTPSLAASILQRIAARHDVVGVFTRPDAVRGRGKKLVPSPVKQAALDLGLKVFTITSFSDEDAQQSLRALRPDAICVAACGLILPAEVLAIPRLSCLNVHTSLLPRWRGAAPMQRAILACDQMTGASIMRMEEGLDTGPYCKRVEVPLEGLYLTELQERLAQSGSTALLEALDELQDGTLIWTEQPSEGVTYAAKIGKGELDVDPGDTACAFCAKVRASDDAHAAHAIVAERTVTIERAHVADDDRALEACAGLSAGQGVFRAKRFLLMCADGPIEIDQVKPEGKKSMDARSFAAGIQGIKNATVLWGRA